MSPSHKHTKGPWEASQDHALRRDPEAWVIKHKTDTAVSHVAQCHPAALAPESGGTLAANARLIATAPEMLEALEVALDSLNHAYDRAPAMGTAQREYEKAMRVIRAAIAKATV